VFVLEKLIFSELEAVFPVFYSTYTPSPFSSSITIVTRYKAFSCTPGYRSRPALKEFSLETRNHEEPVTWK
jgi:hypothetical protein